jgi:hypothetical protein
MLHAAADSVIYQYTLISWDHAAAADVRNKDNLVPDKS